jgi:hypothetical protein
MQASALLADAESLYPLYEKEETAVALARINGVACGIVTLAQEKISCCAASHAARFVRFCDAFSLPVITNAGKGWKRMLRLRWIGIKPPQKTAMRMHNT